MRIADKNDPSGAQLWSPFRRPAGRASVAALVAGVLAVVVIVPRAQAAPGTWTQAQVNASIVKAVAYIDTQQNLNGSYGVSVPVAETGMALVAYSVLANGNFSSLPASYQLHVQNAIAWLLGQQNVAGWWADFGFYKTYGTGIVLAGLSSFQAVNAAVPVAIVNGRTFLFNEFQGPAFAGCSSADGSPTAYFCGGWNYEADPGRSDESNTGFAVFGLQLTGGVPAAIAVDNINWQHHVQTISSNPFSGIGHNDGGASYQPVCAHQNCGSFSSNANDTGAMLFGLGYDGVAGTDPHVIAGIKLAQDILDDYELEQPTYNMIYHTGAVEDGSCMIGVGACDWHFSDGEGGFHYSVFALTKGLGEYIAPSLTDPANWYAKVIDLHLTQQQANGSWPRDGRDDGSALLATEFPVATIGLVGVAPPSHGRMTGGGSVFTSSGVRVTHGFELHCTPSDGANSLEVNWDTDNRFHLTSLASATCTDNAAIEPNPPDAGFDTYRGSGTGLYNGQPGATADWTFTDAGEPGKNDTATITITDASNIVVLTVSGKMDNGNQQAHKN